MKTIILIAGFIFSIVFTRETQALPQEVSPQLLFTCLTPKAAERNGFRIRVFQVPNPNGDNYLRARVDRFIDQYPSPLEVLMIYWFFDGGKKSDIFYGDGFYLQIYQNSSKLRNAHVKYISGNFEAHLEGELQCYNSSPVFLVKDRTLRCYK